VIFGRLTGFEGSSALSGQPTVPGVPVDFHRGTGMIPPIELRA
jgi:hypothetical protein